MSERRTYVTEDLLKMVRDPEDLFDTFGKFSTRAWQGGLTEAAKSALSAHDIANLQGWIETACHDAYDEGVKKGEVDDEQAK